MKKTKERTESREDIVMDGKFWVDSNGMRHRYVDPMTDEGFKLLFGSEGNEDLVKELLNRIIPDANIVNLRYCNTEHLGMTEDVRKAVFDVYCENADGVRFLVEMQNWSQRHFNKRAVYYSTYAIQDQAASEKRHQLKTLGKDKWDYNYAPVYVVCFMSFNMKTPPRQIDRSKKEDYLSFYRYLDVETGDELGDGTTLVFIELKKFSKSIKECRTDREKLLYTIKNMSRQLKMPKELSDPMLKEMYDKAEIAALPKNVRLTYIKYIMSRNDELNSRAEMLEDALAEGYAKGVELGREKGLEDGRKEGREVGREEGRKEGREEGIESARKDIATKMKQSGISIKEIALFTGLDEKVIMDL